MAIISLAGGRYTAQIDDEDVLLVSRHKWFLSRGYAYANVRQNGQSKKIKMHRLVTQAPPRQSVDHINGDTLDNRRANLRFVTHAQNMQNRSGASKLSTTGVRNVVRFKGGKFQARIQVNGKSMSMGVYATVDEAAVAAAEGRRRFMTHSRENSEPFNA